MTPVPVLIVVGGPVGQMASSLLSIRYGDSIACTSVERRKAWYDGGNGSQIWRLLERQKSQQKNLGIAGRCDADVHYSY